MSAITTHVLDLSLGRPAAAVPVTLERQHGGTWKSVGKGSTDGDGRLKTLLPEGPIEPGAYRLTFEVKTYFEARSQRSFYSSIPIQFVIQEGAAHYHVPLLLGPYGYSTYRGS